MVKIYTTLCYVHLLHTHVGEAEVNSVNEGSVAGKEQCAIERSHRPVRTGVCITSKDRYATMSFGFA